MSEHTPFAGLSPLSPKPLSINCLELQHEVLRLRDEVVGLRARLAEAEVVIKRTSEAGSISSQLNLDERAAYLTGIVDDLESQISAIKSSSTWRIGRALLLPVRIVKRS